MILRRANISFDEQAVERLAERIPNIRDFGNEPSDADSAGDYLLGITMILAFLISTALNPFTFLFNYHQDGRLKTTRVLFMLLAISDFLTNIYRRDHYRLDTAFCPQKCTHLFVLAPWQSK